MDKAISAILEVGSSVIIMCCVVKDGNVKASKQIVLGGNLDKKVVKDGIIKAEEALAPYKSEGDTFRIDIVDSEECITIDTIDL